MTEQVYHSLKEEQLIKEIKAMERFSGPPSEFWPLFLQHAALLAETKLALLFVRSGEEGNWKNLSSWPPKREQAPVPDDFINNLFNLANESVEAPCIWPLKDNTSLFALGIPIDLDEKNRKSVSIFLLQDKTIAEAEKAATQLSLISAIPCHYQRERAAKQAASEVNQFAEALDIMVLLNAENKFMAAAMCFCNEIASRYQCSRVSFGWLSKGYVRLQAISHMEKFEKKMDVVQSLEAAMEESFDQNEEIIWPSPTAQTTVTRDHEVYTRTQGIACMASLPIRVDDEVIGVLSCERMHKAFSDEDLRGLRVLCDQAARRLGDLKEHDRWFGAKITSKVREGLSKFFGVEHTFLKLLGVSICIALFVILFGKLPYRVEAPFILKSDDVKYLPSPFDGYIDKVFVEIGDLVKGKGPLLSLDTEELYLEESAAIANQNRYTREAEKARAENALAEMKISYALAEQAKAKLEQVHYLISQADIRAPFDGIVVEGDLKELLGAPVRKGDVLFKIARLEKMFIELEVDEKDIHEISTDETGEIAFISRPDLKFPFQVERIDPVAIAKEKKNVFIVRCKFSEKISNWWRPGMSGVAKVNVGKRNILWILTHRTVDFFRILLWW